MPLFNALVTPHYGEKTCDSPKAERKRLKAESKQLDRDITKQREKLDKVKKTCKPIRTTRKHCITWPVT